MTEPPLDGLETRGPQRRRLGPLLRAPRRPARRDPIDAASSPGG